MAEAEDVLCMMQMMTSVTPKVIRMVVSRHRER